jgi:hypothetical protein
VSFGLRQSLLIAAAGAVIFIITAVLARRQMMSLRFTILWVFIAVSGMVGALLTPLVEPVSELFGMSPTGLLLAGASLILLTITMLLSVSVSGLQSELRDVAEAHALLARELDEVAETRRIDSA